MSNIFHSFKISEKIGAVFLILLAMMGIGGMVGLYNARQIVNTTTRFYVESYVLVDTLSSIEKELLAEQQEVVFTIASHDTGARIYLQGSIKEHDKRVKELFEEHLINKANKPFEAELYSSFERELSEYKIIRDEVIRISEHDVAKKANVLLRGDVSVKFKRVIDALHVLLAEEKGSAFNAFQKTGEFSNIITWVTIAATILAVILAAGLWYMISRSIVKPIEALENSARKIAGGNMGERVVVASNDEIGALAREINSMVENLEYYYANLEKKVKERTETIKVANEELFRKKHETEILNEELVRVNKMKSQFLANVSHELRTPLNSIMGFSELLTEKLFGELNEKQGQYVNYIHTSGSHLLHLINNILDLSKVEAGRLELEPEEFPLADVIGEVLNIIRPMAHKKGVLVESKTTPMSPPVRLDRPKFKQIMLNLLSNAVKFNKDGGRVNIDWDISEEPKGAIMERVLHISVKDTGIGIKDEDIPRIFREFEQVDSSITREYGGTGLGLALTKKLVELHNGRIWLESEYGKGTTFSLVIPQGVSGLEQTFGMKDMSVFQQLTHELLPSTILVASESADMDEFIKVYLGENGYNVEIAADGIDVLKKAALIKPFAVILGIMLPKKDGWEILRELKASHDTCEIPVIIVSATNNKELGFSLGAADYLVKPVNKDKLLHTLGKLSFITKLKRHPFSILAIDDEPQVLEFLGDILEKKGFGIIKATGGEEGIALAIERDPDLIILDLMMPRVSGFDVVEQLKKHPTAKDIPIVIFTAKDITEIDKIKLGDNIANIIRKAEFSKNGLLNEIKKLEMAYPARAKMIDPLTGIFNHRYFSHWIVQEVARSQRYELPFAVLLIDVDRLQSYNTRNGFLLGNEVLVLLSRLIEDNIRMADCLIRYGGDEFLVVLPNIKQEAAAAVAEKLRVRVQNYVFPSSNEKKGERITISIGVAGLPADSKESNELMLNVKEAARSAFLSGGNKVLVFRKVV